MQRLASRLSAPLSANCLLRAPARVPAANSVAGLSTGLSKITWAPFQASQPAFSFFSTLSTTTTNDEGDALSAKPPAGPFDVPGATLSKSDKMVILYTCRVCETRSARTISKPAYNEGVVLVRCPGCQKLHLIADRLGYFGDEDADVEKLLAAKGERVRRATLGAPELKLGNGTSSSSSTASPSPSATSSAAAAERSANIAAALSSISASDDKCVLEFSPEDLMVLQSKTKSVDLKTQREVEPRPQPRQQHGEGQGQGGKS